MDKQQPSDGDISRGCRQNDPNAWRHLIRANTSLVYRIAMRMLRDKRDAEDASQEVFMRVYRSIDSHDPTRPIAPWISKITYHVCLKRISQKSRVEKKEFALVTDNPAEDVSENTPESQLSKKQMANRIEMVLDKIPAQDRALIAMRYSEGFTDSEIAESTDMPVGTVKTRLYRARAKLRKLLTPFTSEVSV